MYKLIAILGVSLLLTACTSHMSFDVGIGAGISQDETKKGVALDVFGNYEGGCVSNSQDY